MLNVSGLVIWFRLFCIVMVNLVNLALSKFSEREKGAEQFINKPERILNKNALFFLTLGPSGYCPLMESGQGRPQGGGRGPICCKATRWMGRTAECGTGWRSRLPQLLWWSCLSERWTWCSGFPFAARGLGRHQGKAGLKQEEECRDRADSWGRLGTTGSPLGLM